MIKRLISVILIICMLMPYIPTLSFAAEGDAFKLQVGTFGSGGATVTVDANQNITWNLSGADGNSKDLTYADKRLYGTGTLVVEIIAFYNNGQKWQTLIPGSRQSATVQILKFNEYKVEFDRLKNEALEYWDEFSKYPVNWEHLEDVRFNTYLKDVRYAEPFGEFTKSGDSSNYTLVDEKALEAGVQFDYSGSGTPMKLWDDRFRNYDRVSKTFEVRIYIEKSSEEYFQQLYNGKKEKEADPNFKPEANYISSSEFLKRLRMDYGWYFDADKVSLYKVESQTFTSKTNLIGEANTKAVESYISFVRVPTVLPKNPTINVIYRLLDAGGKPVQETPQLANPGFKGNEFIHIYSKTKEGKDGILYSYSNIIVDPNIAHQNFSNTFRIPNVSILDKSIIHNIIIEYKADPPPPEPAKINVVYRLIDTAGNVVQNTDKTPNPGIKGNEFNHSFPDMVFGMDGKSYFYNDVCTMRDNNGANITTYTLDNDAFGFRIGDITSLDTSKTYTVTFEYKQAPPKPESDIIAVLKPKTYNIEVVANKPISEQIELVLDSSDSAAALNGKIVPISSRRYWLFRDNGNEGTVNSAGVHKFDYTIDQPAMAPNTTKTITIPISVRVYSQALQEAGVNKIMANAYNTITININAVAIPEPTATAGGRILFEPATSYDYSGNREGWVNNLDVRVTYEPEYYSTRKKPTGNGSKDTKTLSVDYGYTWSELDSVFWCEHQKQVVDVPGYQPPYVKPVPDDPNIPGDQSKPGYWPPYVETTYKWVYDPDNSHWDATYSSGSKTYTDNPIVQGFWDLTKIITKGTAISSTTTVTHGNTVSLIEGKNTSLSAEPSDWESHASWYDAPSMDKKPGSSDGYGNDPQAAHGYDDKNLSSGSWNNISDINATTQYEKNFTKPTKPSWAGTSGIYKVDKTAPSASIDSGIYQKNVWYGAKKSPVIVVSGKVADNRSVTTSGIYSGTLSSTDELTGSTGPSSAFSRELESSEMQTRSITLRDTGKYTVTVDVQDYASNRTVIDSSKYMLDNTLPVFTVGQEAASNWIKEDIVIPIKAEDAHSGLDVLRYQLRNKSVHYLNRDNIDLSVDLNKRSTNVKEGDEIREISQIVNINRDGIYEVYLMQLSDAVGNTISDVISNEYKYDATHPNIDLVFNNAVYANNRIEYICDQENNVTVKVLDNLSGVARFEWALTKSESEPSALEWNTVAELVTDEDTRDEAVKVINLQNGLLDWATLKSGKWFLHIRVTDRANNVLRTANPGEVSVSSTHLDLMTIEDGVKEKTINPIPIFINKAGDEPDPNTTQLRIIEILDPTWKSISEKQDITTHEMGVYNSNIPSKIKLGYRVNFELDTVGFGTNLNDNVTVYANQYVKVPTNISATGYSQVDMYIPSDKYGTKYQKVSNTDKMKLIPLVRNGSIDSSYFQPKYSPNPGEIYTWYISYYIRPDVKFVLNPTGDPSATPAFLDTSIFSESQRFINTAQYPELLVTFDIIAEKGYSVPMILDYTREEDRWGTSSNNTSYGVKKSTGQSLLGKGTNHGEVFWYDIQHTALDDLQGQINFGGY